MKVLLTFLALSLFSANTYAAKATHGMVLFGKEHLMAYHLPMFHKIHAKQVVFSYTLPQLLKDQLLSYQDALLTFVPEPFDLDAFLAAPHPLKGDVYLGHFEKDGELVMSGVTLENVYVQYNKPLKKPEGLENHYVFFGTQTDLYQVHLIDGGLPVDHILKASTTAKPWEFEHLIGWFSKPKSSSPELINEGETWTVTISYETHCRLHDCPTITKKLEVTSERTYFKDDVM